MTELATRAPQLDVAVLVEFCRALIRNHPSGDVIELSLAAAQQATGASDRDMKLLRVAVFNEAGKSAWPKGFF